MFLEVEVERERILGGVGEEEDEGAEEEDCEDEDEWVLAFFEE